MSDGKRRPEKLILIVREVVSGGGDHNLLLQLATGPFFLAMEYRTSKTLTSQFPIKLIWMILLVYKQPFFIKHIKTT